MNTDFLLLLAVVVVSALRVLVYQASNREIDEQRLRRPVGMKQGQRKEAVPQFGRVPARRPGANAYARRHS